MGSPIIITCNSFQNQWNLTSPTSSENMPSIPFSHSFSTIVPKSSALITSTTIWKNRRFNCLRAQWQVPTTKKLKEKGFNPWLRASQDQNRNFGRVGGQRQSSKQIEENRMMSIDLMRGMERENQIF